ncbi:hypothetical protein BK644_19315 [Pseudomonas protegens]|nr:hypothetical protein BK644_19315 [Pseudomonas protegens]
MGGEADGSFKISRLGQNHISVNNWMTLLIHDEFLIFIEQTSSLHSTSPGNSKDPYNFLIANGVMKSAFMKIKSSFYPAVGKMPFYFLHLP